MILYRWFIDYWMEEGLLRDIYTHKITTPKHWNMLMQPFAHSKDEIAYDLIVGNDTVVTPSYDPHCVNDVSNGCHPVQVISAERLVEASTGPAEGRKIAMTMMNHPGIAEHVIEEEAWQCIWTELIVNKKGLKTFIDREGVFSERDYNFSTEMLTEMLHELDRMIDKYSSPEWNLRQTSQDLVDLFNEHRALIQEEYDEVASGIRVLTERDFLGPKERKKRKLQKFAEEIRRKFGLDISKGVKDRRQLDLDDAMVAEDSSKKDYSDFYAAVDNKLLENRASEIESQVFSDDMAHR